MHSFNCELKNGKNKQSEKMADGTANQSEMVHPAVKPLSNLLGTWKGEGEGFFPTISSFNYSEELQFSHSPNKVRFGFMWI